MNQTDYELYKATGRKKVLIGVHLRCVGCGGSFGMAAVDDSEMTPEEWEDFSRQPAWTYSKSECPVCLNSTYPIDKPE